MQSRIKCANPIVLQEICDHLNDLKIPYLAEVRALEVHIKSKPHLIERLIEEHDLDAQLLMNV